MDCRELGPEAIDLLQAEGGELLKRSVKKKTQPSEVNQNKLHTTAPDHCYFVLMTFLQSLKDQDIFKSVAQMQGAATTIEHSRLAQRNGEELFLAHQSTIRCSKISDSTSYKVLDVPEIKFAIKGIKINSSGTLLAAYNDANIVVVSLPSSSFMTTSESLISVKSFVIGTGELRNTSVRDLSWNPTSRFDSSLVTLCEDGVLRTFDLNVSLDTPASAYDLKVSTRNQVGYAADVADDPVSITFGSLSSLAGALTLYVLNSDGDVFSIYPFFPMKIVATKALIEDLLNETVLMTNATVDSGNTLHERAAINQLRFVKRLWDQVPTATLEVRGTLELCVLHPDPKDKMILQGPHIIQPYPEELYNDLAMGISTIKSESVDLLAVTYKSSGFLVLLPDVNTTMRFRDKEFEEFVMTNETGEFSPILVTLEFKSSQSASPTYISSISDEHNFFIQRENTIYKATLGNWSRLLEDACLYGEDNAFTNVVESRLITQLDVLATLKTGETFEGVTIVENEFAEKFAGLLTSSSFHICDLHPTTLDRAEEKTIDPDYKTLLGGPFFEIESLIKEMKSINILAPTDSSSPIQANEGGLRDMNHISSQVLKGLVPFHKTALSLNHRVDNQKIELARQLDTSHNLIKRLTNVTSRESSNIKAVNSFIERQEALSQRFQRLAEKLQGSVDLPLSTAEKSWFNEIHKLTLSFNRDAKQSSVLQGQLSFVKTEIDSKKLESNRGFESVQDWDDISDILKEGKLIIDRTSKSLQTNMSKLESGMKKTYV